MNNITKLEQTLIDIATDCPADVQSYSSRRDHGHVTAEMLKPSKKATSR